MFSNKVVRFVIVTLVFTMFLFLHSNMKIEGKEPLILLTPEEAATLSFTDEEWAWEIILTPKQGLMRGMDRAGPIVIVEKPKPVDTNEGPTIYTPTPMDVTVLFQENGAPLDLGSLKVVVKKSWILKKDVTSDLFSYLNIHEKGVIIEAKDVVIPAGKFKIEFEISDKEGRKTVGEYRLVVEKST